MKITKNDLFNLMVTMEGIQKEYNQVGFLKASNKTKSYKNGQIPRNMW